VTDEWIWSTGGMKFTGEVGSTREKIYLSATTNPTRIELGPQYWETENWTSEPWQDPELFCFLLTEVRFLSCRSSCCNCLHTIFKVAAPRILIHSWGQIANAQRRISCILSQSTLGSEFQNNTVWKLIFWPTLANGEGNNTQSQNFKHLL